MKEKEFKQNSYTYFPHHKRTDKERNEKYYKECIDAGINMAWWNENSFNSVRANRKDKILAYNLVNNKIDKEEQERVLNPFRLRDVNFPTIYKNYPILLQNMNILLGEERKKFFNPVVNIINEDFVTEKLSYIDDEFTKFVVTRLISDNINEQQSEQELGEFNKWRLNYRERRERMVQQIVEYGYRSQEMKEKFSRGFEDLLVAGEKIYIADIYGGEPILRKGNPLNIYTLRSGESPYIEDADIIIEDGFLPVGEVIDRYYDELKPSQINDLENRSKYQSGKFINAIKSTPEVFGDVPFTSGIIDNELNVNEIILAGRDLTSTYGGYYDKEGNVRVTRVLWRGMRKIGVITYYDKDGNELKKLVPEQYEPISGEDVKWEWVNEWQEGTKVGYDIYLRMRPLPFQSRKLDNPSMSSPGIVGVSANINSNKSKSFIITGKEWQYLFNAFMAKLELLFIKNKGAIATFPMHLLPDGWTMDQALFYTEYMGWLPVDAFTEAKEGSMTGKPAGSMQTPAQVLNLSTANEIQHALLMLDFIKNQLDDLSGITPQRRGAIQNRETAQGIERSVTQSSLNTEKWYGLADLGKIRALKAYVQVAKYAWRGKSFKRNYVLDDGSIGVLDYDDGLLEDIEVGIDISLNPFDQQLMEVLRNQTDRLFQSNTPISVVIDIFRTKDPTVLQKKIKAWEDEQMQKAEQQEQADRELQQAAIQQKQQSEDAKMELEYEKLDREDMNKELDRQNKIQTTAMTSMGFNEDKDMDADGVPDILELSKLSLEQSKSSYDSALAKRKQVFEEKKHNDEMILKKKELQLKNKDIDTKLKIAKSKPKLTVKK